jgi:RNase H-like domain found in reverse transcriptase
VPAYVSEATNFLPISCYLHLLTDTKKMYFHKTKKELLAVKNTVPANKHILNGTLRLILVLTDHRNLEALTKFGIQKQRPLTWRNDSNHQNFNSIYSKTKQHICWHTLLATLRPHLKEPEQQHNTAYRKTRSSY